MQIEYARIIRELLGREQYLVVGKSVERTDAVEKLTGKAKFTMDLLSKDALTVKVLRSAHPRAIVNVVDTNAAFGVPGVVAVLTADDVPGTNEVGIFGSDQPLLVKREARFVGDAIALVAAKDEEAALRGVEACKVDYEPLPAILEPEEALKNKVLIREHGNIAGKVRVRKGDTDAGFSRAASIVENVYTTGHQDHAYVETEAAIAMPEGHNRFSVIATTQSPSRTRTTVARILGLTQAQVRIVVPYVGGGFGGKDTMGPIVSAMAALVAAKTETPAVLTYSREESIAYHFKRAPFRIRYKSGATKDGKLTAVEVDFVVDGGAYPSAGVLIMHRAGYHATGPYEVPNVKVDGLTIYTNRIPVAAFNGFGNPQMHFAIESQMDILAEKLGIDPVEFRLRNALAPGGRTGTDQLLDHSAGMKDLIMEISRVAQWNTKKKIVGSRKRRGIGIGCSWHGCGTTGIKQDWAGASLIVNPDGSVCYSTGIVELGQGSRTAHMMMIAEILGIPLEWVKIERLDTASVPESGETHAQRGTFMGGTAAADAAVKLRRRLNILAAEILECDEKDIEIADGKVVAKSDTSKTIGFKALAMELYMRGISPAEYGFVKSKRGHADPETGLGSPYATYTFGCCIAEVEVDVETGETTVLKIQPGIAAGKIVHPEMVRGQIYGCTLMGIGEALMEQVVIENGRIRNTDFTDYVTPNVKDKPEFAEPLFIEDEYVYSAFGAKGVGEIALVSVLPAIVNAICNATGIRFYEVPLSSEKIFFALRGKLGEIS